MASLNARSIFKDADKNTQRLFLSYLKSSSLSLDILCLQEVSAFHRQDHLTQEQSHYFTNFLFPRCAVVFTKYCAIICLNQKYYLENAMISLDERCIGVTVMDKSNHSTVCTVINVYGPAQQHDRLPFLDTFMSLPQVHLVSDSLPSFLLGDFNLPLAELAESCSDDRFLVWYEWVSVNFVNCFPDGRPTFQRGVFRSTIDYVFSNVLALPRVTSCQQQYLPSNWTDHQMLCVDLLSLRDDVGPGFWRFNSSLLLNDSFLALLDTVASVYIEEWYQNSEQQSVQTGWEAFKRAIRDTCETFSTGFRKQRHSKIQHAQNQFNALLSTTTGNSEAHHNLAHKLTELMDQEIQMEMQQLLLRSATRWHEKGERNTKYFYKVIRSREAQHTIQAIKSSTTGATVTSTADILKEAHRFYSTLYTPEDIDTDAVESLLQNIPESIKLDERQFALMDADPSDAELLSVVNHTPSNKSPGLDGIPFEVYKYLFTKFPRIRSLFLQVLIDAFHGTISPSW
jgi:endonuclease/exonuclease/phosphatase family metal-dependent hydrolase